MFLKMYCYAWPNVLQYLLCIANVLNKLDVIHIYIRIHSSIHYNIFQANYCLHIITVTQYRLSITKCSNII